VLERIREARRNESGFTLIELLIVIVILGVLAGIVVFAVGAFNNEGKASACKSDQKNLEIASEAFYAKANPHKYPTAITDLTAAANPYLKEAPTNITMTFDPTGVAAPTSACVA
jgi:prepilin-type N-terminal cleavage/methylation domain-containing protein